ncbi:MAG: hypothetical protein RLZZ29_1569, partial [Cyanobacteriota bacterium]
MLNSSVSQIETFTLTTEPKGEDIEIETTVDIPPLHRTQ